MNDEAGPGKFDKGGMPQCSDDFVEMSFEHSKEAGVRDIACGYQQKLGRLAAEEM